MRPCRGKQGVVHDMDEVGQDGRRHCGECQRQYQRRRRQEPLVRLRELWRKELWRIDHRIAAKEQV